MAKYKFDYIEDDYDDRHNTVSFSDDNEGSWDYVAENFLYFLRSIGFIFDEKNVREFIGDKIFEIVAAENSDGYNKMRKLCASDEGGHDGIQ